MAIYLRMVWWHHAQILWTCTSSIDAYRYHHWIRRCLVRNFTCPYSWEAQPNRFLKKRESFCPANLSILASESGRYRSCCLHFGFLDCLFPHVLFGQSSHHCHATNFNIHPSQKPTLVLSKLRKDVAWARNQPNWKTSLPANSPRMDIFSPNPSGWVRSVQNLWSMNSGDFFSNSQTFQPRYRFEITSDSFSRKTIYGVFLFKVSWRCAFLFTEKNCQGPTFLFWLGRDSVKTNFFGSPGSWHQHSFRCAIELQWRLSCWCGLHSRQFGISARNRQQFFVHRTVP